MKTILISVPTGIIARNILRTDVFRILKERKDLRIVLLMPPKVDEYFETEVMALNVTIEEFSGRFRAGAFRHFILHPFAKHLVFTSSTALYLRYGNSRVHKNSLLVWIFGWLFFFPLSRIRFLKKMCRKLEFIFSAKYDRILRNVFEKYTPDLVFATNILHDPGDLALIREAKRREILSVGMVKSWDNLDKYLIFSLPDFFLVWNEVMRESAENLQLMPKEKIFTAGVPQFDIYSDQSIIWPRGKYCQVFGFPEKNKIIFFGSEGFAFPYDEEAAEIIYKMIQQKEIKPESSLLVRRHFRELAIENDRFAKFGNLPEVVLDAKDRLGNCFSRGWDPSFEDMARLANHLFHCDLMVTSCSTLSLDAICFDKPVINIAFDGFYQRPRAISAMKWYELANYQPVLRSGGVKMVKSPEELKTAINDYLQNPDLERDGRQKLREDLCWKLDGKSGQRIAEFLLEKIYGKK